MLDFALFFLSSYKKLTFSGDRSPGFSEIRLIPSRPGIAFVEYETEGQAGVAKQNLKNYAIDDKHIIEVNFARR